MKETDGELRRGLEELRVELKQAYVNLTAVQTRCTELLERVRLLEAALSAMGGPQ